MLWSYFNRKVVPGLIEQGMVIVENATLVPVATREELESVVAKGLEKRHTSGTQMNAESSRSHLILSIIVESTNLQSQVLMKGKVSCYSWFSVTLVLFAGCFLRV